MLQHDVAAVTAVAGLGADVADNAGERGKDLVGGLPLAIAGHRVQIESLVELGTICPHAAEKAGRDLPRFGWLNESLD